MNKNLTEGLFGPAGEGETDFDTFPGDLVNVLPAQKAGMIETNDGVKVGAQYAPSDEKIASTSSFISQTEEDAALRQATYEESVGWYNGITADIFGS